MDTPDKQTRRCADFSHYPNQRKGRRSKQKGARTQLRENVRLAALAREREQRKREKQAERELSKALKAQKERRVTLTHTMAKSTLERLRMIPAGKRSRWIENLILRECDSILLKHGKTPERP